MLEQIAAIRERAVSELDAARSAEELAGWQARYLSRKGEVKLLLREVGKLGDAEAKKSVGREVNLLSSLLEDRLAERRASLEAEALEQRLAAERVDISLAPTRTALGGRHPVSSTLDEICDIFARMGFQIWESPHVETDEFNFELLNMPPHHPARDMQDTFFVSDDIVLRTHTSPGQIHAMRALAPEALRVLLPGTVFRNEQITARSEIQFTQVEGLAIGESIGLADLRGVLQEFVRQFFGPDREMLLRGSYFPFTEPSVEVDISCSCAGAGCRLCKHTGWLEILGAGVVHPSVLAGGGYDPERASGFAFGIGVERMVMLRHGIDDIRHFYSGDLRFLEQFR